MIETSVSLPAGIGRVLIAPEEIRARVAQLGSQISKDYAGKNLLLVGVLKGSFVFLSDLLRNISLPCSADFICLSSYSGSSSTGVVQLLLDLRNSIENKDVLLVEDIIDTGLTLSYLFQNLKIRKPRSLEVCAFLDKPECRKVRVGVKYIGFAIPNEFVVGYGLDYNEQFRNLPYVGVYQQTVK